MRVVQAFLIRSSIRAAGTHTAQLHLAQVEILIDVLAVGKNIELTVNVSFVAKCEQETQLNLSTVSLC